MELSLMDRFINLMNIVLNKFMVVQMGMDMEG